MAKLHGPRAWRGKKPAGKKGLDPDGLVATAARLGESAPPAARKPARAPAPADGYRNGTERRYAAVLAARRAAGEVLDFWYEPLSLKLADATFAKPDFLVHLADGTLELHEVKGGLVSEVSWAKVKIAARLYPFVYRVAQWRKGAWTIVRVGESPGPAEGREGAA